MKAQNLLLSALALAAAIGCSKEEDGKGVTEPSRRYEGVEEPPKWQPEQNPGTVPTQGAPQGANTNAEQPINAAADNVDQRGQTTTPATAFGDGGGTTAAPSAGTAPSGRPQNTGGPGDKLDPEAKAVFKAAPGIKLKGDAELEVVEGGVKIEVEVAKAPPGPKGIHIHQKPDCTNIPAKSMGDHFAPDVKEHGMPGGGAHHLGDLGNIQIGEDGEGELEITVQKATLKEGDPMSLLGRAIVIHEKNDEGASAQPSGNSGKPIACAVIKPE
jgi:superoxide dismutase, Cu-Zn family